MTSKTNTGSKSTHLDPKCRADDATAGPSYLFMDLCTDKCRFLNGYNTCWLNASIQATVNLRIVWHKLRSRSVDHLIGLSGTPLLAGRFLERLHYPWRKFSLDEDFMVLEELRYMLPHFYETGQNHPLDLLDSLLLWLDKCGVSTQISINHGKCTSCGCTTNSRKSSVQIYRLPPAVVCGTSVKALLSSAIHGLKNTERCTQCGSMLKDRYWNTPDILAFHLPRSAADGSEHRAPVLPDETVAIPIEGGGSESYSLSSVICQQGNELRCSHLWTYKIHSKTNIRLENQNMFVVPGETADKWENGVMYFYERIRKQKAPTGTF